MLRAVLTALTLLVASPVLAQEPAELGQALRIDEVMDVMAAEGVEDGKTMQADLFPQSSPARWERVLRQVYDAERMRPAFDTAFAADLAGSDLAPGMMDFLTSDLGRKVVVTEIAARRQLLDEAEEDRARLEVEEMRAARDPRLAALQAFADANDLVEMNVVGGLNANLAFFHGMQEAGAFGEGMTEEDMLRDVWSQEPQIRHETEAWLYPYLLTAYRDLSAEELAAYTAFSASGEGQALNRALFAGFDAVFLQISRNLGLAVGREMLGRDI